MRPRSPRRRRSIGLALAGGGPFGAIYEVGALMALEDAIEGLDLNDLHCYVGVSAGSFLAAALANGIPVSRIHALFIEGWLEEGALLPEVFMRPALGEYLRRARTLPRLFAHALWRYARHPSSHRLLETFASLATALPTGVFDNEAIHSYLEAVFSEPGRTNDFRRLSRRLYLVASDLDTGASVSFGRPGHDHVPISRAVQASAALPGLFPPVEIAGRYYVDGALRKTLHASEALEAGASLVLCVNPIVPFDAKRAARRGRAPHRLVEGGLPVVLSQTFRAVIHSRMAIGISRYRTDYPGSDVVLFEPESDDAETFFTNIFSYTARGRICRHAYERTIRDLDGRRSELAPILDRHGLLLRPPGARKGLPAAGLPLARPAEPRTRWRAVTADLGGTLGELRHWLEQESARAHA